MIHRLQKLARALFNPNVELRLKIVTFQKIIGREIKIISRLRIMQKPKNSVTAKWGMVTRHQKPFGDGVKEITAKQFDKAHTELVDRHIRKTFKGYWGEKQIIQDLQATIGETITFFGVRN